MRFNEMLEGSRADVAIRVYGDDLSVLLESIEKIEGLVKKIDGVSEAEMDELTAIRRGPVLDATLNSRQLARRAVHPKEAMDAFITGMAGREIGLYYEGDLVYPIVLRLGDEYRRDLRAISVLPISLPETLWLHSDRSCTFANQNRLPTLRDMGANATHRLPFFLLEEMWRVSSMR
jgi:cobalt-zinc-cadmium resistance protein CzcA